MSTDTPDDRQEPALSGELRLEVLSVGNASVSGPMELRPNETVEIPGP